MGDVIFYCDKCPASFPTQRGLSIHKTRQQSNCNKLSLLCQNVEVEDTHVSSPIVTHQYDPPPSKRSKSHPNNSQFHFLLPHENWDPTPLFSLDDSSNDSMSIHYNSNDSMSIHSDESNRTSKHSENMNDNPPIDDDSRSYDSDVCVNDEMNILEASHNIVDCYHDETADIDADTDDDEMSVESTEYTSTPNNPELTSNTLYETMYKKFTEDITKDDIITIKLLHLLSGERNIPLTLFEKIMSWRNWSVEMKPQPVQVRNIKKNRIIRKRNIILSHYTSILKLNHLTSNSVSIRSLSCPNHYVPVQHFSFKSMMISMLSDPNLMTDANLLINPRTLRNKVNFDTNVAPIIGDINTGSWYQRTEKDVVSQHERSNNQSPLLFVPIILFVDAISIDMYSNLQLTPVTFTLSIFNKAARNRKENWRPLGFIASPHVKAKLEAEMKLQDVHNCLKIILKELKSCCDEELHLDTLKIDDFIHRNVTVKFALHFVIGDCEGNNKLCGKVSKYDTTLISRDCDCRYVDADKPIVNCNRLRMSELQNMDATLKKALYSHYNLDNAFYGFNFGCNDEGINGCSPPENCHAIIRGMLGYGRIDFFHRVKYKKHLRDMIDSVFDVMRPMLRINNNMKHKLSSRFRFTRGILKEYQLTADEQLNQILLLLVVCQTNKFRWEVNKSKQFLDLIRCLEVMMMFYGWLIQDSYTQEEIDTAERDCIPKHIQDMITNLKRVKSKGVNETKAAVGWKLHKLHVLLHICLYLRRLGAMKNYDGGPSESHQKFFGSQPAQNTQKRHDDSFEEQVCKRLTEKMVISTCNDIVNEYTNNSQLHTEVSISVHPNSSIEKEGPHFQGKKYWVYFRAQYPQSKYANEDDVYYDIDIMYGAVEKTSIFPKEVVTSLKQFCKSNKLRNGYFHLFTEVKIGGTLYRSHYEYHEGNKEWLSWCHIDWTTGTCPANILLICDISNIKSHLTQRDLFVDESNCILLVRSTKGSVPIEDKRLVDGRVITETIPLPQKEPSIFNLWEIDSKIYAVSSKSVASPVYIIPNVRSNVRNDLNLLRKRRRHTVIEVTDPATWGQMFIETYKLREFND